MKRKHIFLMIACLSQFFVIGCLEREMHREYYPDGSIKEEFEMRAEVLHGTTKRYYANGVLSYQGEYDMGERIGWHEYYSTNGKVRFKSFYDRIDGKTVLSKRVTLDEGGNVVAETSFAKKRIDVDFDKTRTHHVGDTLRLKVSILDPKYPYCRAALGYFDAYLNLVKEMDGEPEYIEGNLDHEVVINVLLMEPGADTLRGLIRDFDYHETTDSTGQVIGEDSFFQCPIFVEP